MQLRHPFPRPLALEIEERIIDGLQDDIKALRFCALVCRTWYIRCRYHLLHTITFTTVGDVDKLCTYFQTRPGLKSIVSELKIGSDMNPPGWRDISWISLARQLPRLRKLLLSNRSIYHKSAHISFHQTTLTALRYLHPPLKTLGLNHMQLRSPQDLLRLLVALPSLRNLNLNALQFVIVNQELARKAIMRGSKKVNVTALNVSVCQPLDTIYGTKTTTQIRVPDPKSVLSMILEMVQNKLETLVMDARAGRESPVRHTP